jgi:hypothetical protein
LPSKWDSFDVENELNKIDSDTNNKTRSQFQQELQSVEYELEAILATLDTIRGDMKLKKRRKQLAEEITTRYFPQIDSLRQLLD